MTALAWVVGIVVAFIVVLCILGSVAGVCAERDKHRERARSMYMFIREVQALDKYLEWEGRRRTQETDYRRDLFSDYGEA